MSEIKIKSGKPTQKLFWQNYTAKIITGVWAGFWIFFALASIVSDSFSLTGLMIAVGFVLVFLTSALIPWRWEITGGIILLAEGLIIAICYPIMAMRNFSLSTIMFMELALALPPMLGGVLFVYHNKIQKRQILKKSVEQNN